MKFIIFLPALGGDNNLVLVVEVVDMVLVVQLLDFVIVVQQLWVLDLVVVQLQLVAVVDYKVVLVVDRDLEHRLNHDSDLMLLEVVVQLMLEVHYC